MNEKSFEISIDEVHLITVYYRTKKGIIVEFCVRLMREDISDGRLVCISRFDDAHGYAHQDILGVSGNIIGKPRFSKLGSTGEVVNHAIAHFKLAYRHYGIIFDGN